MTYEEAKERAWGAMGLLEGGSHHVSIDVLGKVLCHVTLAILKAVEDDRRARRREFMRTKKPPTKRSKPRRSGRVIDKAYLAWVRTQPCVHSGPDCHGRVEASHLGERPFGRKADDDTAVPHCSNHHEQWTGKVNARGFCEGWSRQERRDYAFFQTRFYQQHYQAQGNVLARDAK